MEHKIFNSTSEESGTETVNRISEPQQFAVIMHNDHYTTMDFVVAVLQSVFKKDENEAFKIMNAIHKSNFAVCGTYTFDIANTKINQVHSLAKQADFPLKCTIEEA